MPDLTSRTMDAALKGANGATGALRSNPFSNPNFMGGLGQLFSGLFGIGNDPYSAAMGQYDKYGRMAAGVQNPYLKAGNKAIGSYQDWLNTMKDPTGFINNIMGQYQESPFAKYQQQQSINAANNMGSATGLIGSSPLQLQAQQNAQNISSQDMNQWLQNVLGVNTQYGAGQNNLINYGSNAANSLTNLYSQLAQMQGAGAYGQAANENNGWGNIFGGMNGIARGLGWF